MAQSVDLLITHAHLFTMEGSGVGYVPDGAVAISGTRIAAAGPTSEVRARYSGLQTIDASHCAVLPGLIDAHMHTPEAVMRGVAQDVAHWMQGALAPYERCLDDAARLAGTQLSVLEGLKAGTTTFGDFTAPYPGWAETYAQFGVRGRLTPKVNALPPAAWRGGGSVTCTPWMTGSIAACWTAPWHSPGTGMVRRAGGSA